MHPYVLRDSILELERNSKAAEINQKISTEIAKIEDKLAIEAISRFDPQLGKAINKAEPDNYQELMLKYNLEDRVEIVTKLGEPGEHLTLDGTLLLVMYPPEISVEGSHVRVSIPHKFYV